MKIKIFFGVFIAVVILIGISFTSVVGYRGIESSPLFNIRNFRALGKQNMDIIYEYLGKENKFNFPNRDDRTVKLWAMFLVLFFYLCKYYKYLRMGKDGLRKYVQLDDGTLMEGAKVDRYLDASFTVFDSTKYTNSDGYVWYPIAELGGSGNVYLTIDVEDDGGIEIAETVPYPGGYFEYINEFPSVPPPEM